MVEIGDVVLWYESGNPETGGARPALVTGIGSRPGPWPRLTLNSLDSHTKNFMIRDGVCHRGDTTAKADDLREGVWVETPQHRRLLEIIDTVEVLVQAIGADKMQFAHTALSARKAQEEAKRKEKEEWERKKKKD